jgi:hypothetical protein
MAYTVRTHGEAGPFSAVGRQAYSMKAFAKTNITQSELDAIVREVQQLNTIMIIGTFDAGTSDVVNMLIEGAGVDNQSSSAYAGVSGVTITDVAF